MCRYPRGWNGLHVLKIHGKGQEVYNMSLKTSTAIRLFQRKDPISQVSETDRLFSIFTFSYPLEDLTFEKYPYYILGRPVF